MGKPGGLAEKNIRYCQKIEMLQGSFHPLQTGITEHRVFSHDEHGPNITIRACMGHLDEALTCGLGNLSPPDRLEPLPNLLTLQILVPGQNRGQSSHVTGTLDVILAPQGIYTAVFLFHVTGEHGQVGNGLNIVRSAGVLGNAQTIADNGLAAAGIDTGCLANSLQADPGDCRHLLKVQAVQIVAHGNKIFRAHGDEKLIGQVFVQDDPHHGIYQGNISPGTKGQINMGLLGKIRSAGINNDQLCPPIHGPEDIASYLRMRFRGI